MPASSARKHRRTQQDTVAENEVPKKQKKSKYGRDQMRIVTRTSHRDRFYDGNEGEVEGNELENNKILASDEDDEIDQGTIASKRNKNNENKLAYSALVTLLKSEYPEEKKKKVDNAKEDEDRESNADEDEGEVNEDDDEDDDNEIITAEDKLQDNSDVHNKYDAFNLHFNDEEKIENYINDFSKLSQNEQRSKLIKREELNSESGKYVKLEYSFSPQIKEMNENNTESIKSGLTLTSKLNYHNVKQKVQQSFKELKPNSELDLSLIESLLEYQSINFQYYHNEKIKNKYQDYYTLHVTNHILKTRDRILNNNEKKSSIAKQIEEGTLSPNDEPEFRDQGYARPKVLILLPTRNIAWNVVNKIIKNCGCTSIENKSKFKQQFYDSFNIKNISSKEKPKDFVEFFNGNSNDFFSLGIKFTRKTLKLYSKLEQSDVIIGSPLGIKMICENSKYNEFLSSIEVCILDKAEGLFMQNWDHVIEILNKKLNLPPTNFEKLNIDFSRVRMWAINDQYKFITQIISFNKYQTPELMSIIKNSKNLINGISIFKPIDVKNNDIVINNLKLKLIKMGLVNKFSNLKQIFMRFEIDLKLIKDEPNKRFEFFKNVSLPQILNKTSYNFGTLVYFSNYIDYIRAVNYLENETNISFVAIDEYSSQSKLTRNRALFEQRSNQAKLMLYTERLHFYKRYEIKGVRNVLFYQLPSDPDFYEQILEFIADEKIRIDMKKNSGFRNVENNNNEEEEGDDDDDEDDEFDLNLSMVRIMFDKLDMMKLEKIVGLTNAHQLCNGEDEMNEFN